MNEQKKSPQDLKEERIVSGVLCLLAVALSILTIFLSFNR